MSGPLKARRIVVAVGGGIAAYKAVELVRALQNEGAEVRVAMTDAATRFVGPLTFESLTRRAVLRDVLALADDRSIDHVEWGHFCELLVVAPATADLIARLAAGTAGDAVTALALCNTGRLLVCPAMESHMWKHALTQRNVDTLRTAAQASIVPPEGGALASGRSGVWRLASLERIVAAVRATLSARDFAGRRVLVTAGPTREPLDPVRYISNGSSGKMGVALAKAAADRGGDVTIIHGPLQVAVPAGLRTRPVTTALQMLSALEQELVEADVLLMAAAVSDWRPAEVAAQKVKKGAASESVSLVANPDLLVTTRVINPRCVRVGFAAETENLQEHALDKLQRKGLALIVANDVSAPDAGFAVDTNRVVILDGKSEDALPLMGKDEVAHAILDRVRRLL